MKITGRKSLTSVVIVILNICYILAILGILVMFIYFIYVLLFPDPKIYNGEYLLETPALNIHFALENTHVSLTIYLLRLFFEMLIAGCWLGKIYHLRKIFRKINEKVFFMVEHAKRFIAIGLLLIMSTLLSGFREFVNAIQISKNVKIEHVELVLKPGIIWQGLLLGLLIIILSEAFRRGAELQKENDLVI